MTKNNATKALNKRIDGFHAGALSNGANGLRLLVDCTRHSIKYGETSTLSRLVLNASDGDRAQMAAILRAVVPGIKVTQNKKGAKLVHLPLKALHRERRATNDPAKLEGIDVRKVRELRGHIAKGESFRGNAVKAWARGEKEKPAEKTDAEKMTAILAYIDKMGVSRATVAHALTAKHAPAH